ncbi:MAG: hypothetical protein N2508_00460 [Anaerolineae bacterium]|nr:hypothetical protein [Anaerolineae bacterium]
MERCIRIQGGGPRLEDLARQVAGQREAILIEWDEGPAVVLLAYDEYLRLRAAARTTHQPEEALRRLLQIGAAIRAARGGQPLPSPEEVIQNMREERLAQLTDLR